MPWARLDDMLPMHPKIRALNDSAFRLYVSAICWSNCNHTDGRIAAAHLRYVSDVHRPKTCADQLVRAGLWEVSDDGWRIHDYLQYQPSAEKVRRERELKRQRQERWRAGIDASHIGPVDASQDSSSDASPRARARPHPIPSPDTSVVPQGTGGRERQKDLVLIETVKDAMAQRGFGELPDDQARRIAALILGTEAVRNPIAYITAAINRDPNPARFLPTPAPPNVHAVLYANGKPGPRYDGAAIAAKARAAITKDTT